MIHYVRVAVALSRPPKIDEWRRYCVVAATTQEARLIATQMAACTSVMPVESHWESSHRSGPVEPYGVMDCTCWHVAWDEDLQCFTDPEVWEVAANCPHHSEDTAAWAALDVGQNGKGVALTPISDLFRDALRNPPTPETANAGGPDTDDTPVIAVCTVMGHSCAAPGAGPCNGWPRTKTYDYATGGIVTDERFKMIGEHGPELPWRGPRKITLKVCPCGDIRHAPDAHNRVAALPDGHLYATGAIVPDELKRRVDTVKVSSCTCEQVDITAFADGDNRQYTRGRTHGDCPLHGDLAQIRAFGHIDVGDRLRVNGFGVWSIEREAKKFFPPPAPDLTPLADRKVDPVYLSPGRVECTHCDDWSYSFGPGAPGDMVTALAALTAHRTAITESGLTECRSLSQQRPTTLWERLFRAAMRLLPSVD